MSDEKRKLNVEEMEHEVAVIDASKRYRSLGMSDGLARATAEMEVYGDSDGVTSTLARFMQMEKKAVFDEEKHKLEMKKPQRGSALPSAGYMDGAALNRAVNEGAVSAMDFIRRQLMSMK